MQAELYPLISDFPENSDIEYVKTTTYFLQNMKQCKHITGVRIKSLHLSL